MNLSQIPYKWLVAAVFVAGLFIDLLDTTVVNVALPALGREFGVGTTTLEWVVTGYLLSLAVWVPASGWLGDRFGTKRVFLFALAAFTLGSALCGLAWSIESLVAFRVIQGIGGGMMTPVGTAMLFRAFPPAERARASGIMLVPVSIAPMLGPIVGGALVDLASWRWIFWINLPIGALAFVLALVVLKEHVEQPSGGLDLPGLLLCAAGLPAALYALSRGPVDGWGSWRVVGSGALGVGLLGLLVAVELRRRAPLLDLRLFGDRMFRAANLVYFTGIASVLGVLVLLPLQLQELRGLSALESGLTTFPQALGGLIIARPASRLFRRHGPRAVLTVGMAGTAATTACFLWADLETSLWVIRGAMLLRGLFVGISIVAIQAAAFSTISPRAIGRASALFSTNRQVAFSVSVAVLATILTQRTAGHLAGAEPGSDAAHQAAQHGFHDAYLIATLIAALGVGFALLIPKPRATPNLTLVPHRSHDLSEAEARAA